MNKWQELFLTSLIMFGLFLTYPIKLLATNSSVTEAQTETGTTIMTGSGVIVDKVDTGVFVLKAQQLNNFDRYEIQIPGISRHIFGTGMINAINQAELDDFLDTNFSFGHCESVGGGRDLNGWLPGACRMRTPILVLPEKNMLIAYFQPYPKIVRLTRDGQYACPNNTNCIVMKLKEEDVSASPAPMVIIKKSSMDEVYSAFKQVRNQYGFTDKLPSYDVFGSNWETFSELGCSANKQTVLDTVNRFLTYGKLGTVTVGSGYWNGETPGCGTTTDTTTGKAVTTDALEINSEKWGGLAGMNDYYATLKSKGIVPIIGMRQRVSPGVDTTESNVTRIINLFGSLGVTDNLFVSQSSTNSSRWLFRSDDPDVFYMLNNNPSVVDGWLSLISTNYGNFSGIKHDDMVIHDQKGFTGDQNGVNLPDDYYNAVLDRYTNRYGQDFVILTRNTWFANKGDAIVPDWLGQSRDGFRFPSDKNVFPIKYQFDNAITTAMSGYPTVQSSVFSGTASLSKKIDFLRSTQLSVFQGVTMFSKGFWRAEDSDIENALKFYLLLRNRLQQYAFDQAMNSYNSGTLSSLRPLFFDYPNDAKVYDQYSQLTASTDVTTPRNEFMFGNALLVRPIFADASSVSVYLPQGIWKPLLKKDNQYNGPTTINYTLGSESSGYVDYPVFLKEKEILLIGSHPDSSKLQAYVYFATPGKTSIYNYHSSDGLITYRLQAEQTSSGANITNLENNLSVAMQTDTHGKNFMVADNIAPLLVSGCTETNGDTNGNGADIGDLVIWYTEYKFGQVNKADFNCDKKVDIDDLIIWYQTYRSR